MKQLAEHKTKLSCFRTPPDPQKPLSWLLLLIDVLPDLHQFNIPFFLLGKKDWENDEPDTDPEQLWLPCRCVSPGGDGRRAMQMCSHTSPQNENTPMPERVLHSWLSFRTSRAEAGFCWLVSCIISFRRVLFAFISCSNCAKGRQTDRQPDPRSQTHSSSLL